MITVFKFYKDSKNRKVVGSYCSLRYSYDQLNNTNDFCWINILGTCADGVVQWQ